MTGAIGWLRVAVGVALGAAPGSFLKGPTGEEPSGSMLLLARTVGIRDLVIGAGTISALRSGETRDLRRWAVVGLTSDVLDAVAGIASVRLLGRRRALVATGVTLPVIAAGLWGLAHLEFSTDQAVRPTGQPGDRPTTRRA
jgi:hypothetical protein